MRRGSIELRSIRQAFHHSSSFRSCVPRSLSEETKITAIRNLEHQMAKCRFRMLPASMALLISAFTVAAQQPPITLQITSPANGTIVNPGDTITVEVSSTLGEAATQVFVLGQDPFGFAGVVGSLPATLKIKVPADASSGVRYMTAYAVTSSSGARSNEIMVDIERPDLPTSVYTTLGGVYMNAPPARFPLTLFGRFSDGSVTDVTRSSCAIYSSDNPASASIDAEGMVTALAPGEGKLRAVYTRHGRTVEVSIPFSVNYGGFTISVTPSLRTAKTGNTVTYSVSVAPGAGFAGDVALELSAPPGVSGRFDPPVIKGGNGTSILRVSVVAHPPFEGSRIVLTIEGSSRDSQNKSGAALTVIRRR